MTGLVLKRRCPCCNATLDAASSDRCPDCGFAAPHFDQGASQPGFLSLPSVRYQNAYTWLVLVSSLDLMLTMLVLYVWQGFEVNPVAQAIIDEMGFVWAIAFKFAIVVLVVVICEVIGRRDDRGGRTLAVAAVLINSIPVAYTFALLLHARLASTG